MDDDRRRTGAGVASYQLMPDPIKADAGRAIDALVTDLTRGPEAIHNTAGAGPQIDASPALGYPLGPVQGAGTGGGYPLAGESGALQLTTPLDGSSTLQLTRPLTAKAWQVGEYGKMDSVNDDLDLHHVPQKHPAYQVIPGYDEWTAPAIAVPKEIHRKFLNPRSITGTYSGTAKELVHKDLDDLRAAGAPSKAVKKLEKMIQKKYKEYLKE